MNQENMLMNRFLSVAAGLLAVALVPMRGHAEAIYPAALSASDVSTIDRLSMQSFERIRSGKSLEALTLFFGNGSLMQSKNSEMKMLSTQIDSVSGIYGPMGECRLAAERISAGLVVQRLYLCRHGQLLTRWKLLFANTTSGWIGANIFFDDKIALGLDE